MNIMSPKQISGTSAKTQQTSTVWRYLLRDKSGWLSVTGPPMTEAQARHALEFHFHPDRIIGLRLPEKRT